MFCLESKQLATIAVDEHWSFMVAWPKVSSPSWAIFGKPPNFTFVGRGRFTKKTGWEPGWARLANDFGRLPHMNDIYASRSSKSGNDDEWNGKLIFQSPLRNGTKIRHMVDFFSESLRDLTSMYFIRLTMVFKESFGINLVKL